MEPTRHAPLAGASLGAKTVATTTRLAVALCTACLATAASATTVTTYTGNLIGNGDPAVVSQSLGAAATDPDDGTNVAIYHFTMAVAGTLGFSSTGYGAGGIDPWVSIFSGSDSSAVFAGSNGDHAQTIGGDFDLSLFLAAGDYILAISAYENMSFAENLGTGTLADGFIGIVDSLGIGNGAYNVSLTQGDVTGPGNGTVPEPGAFALAGLGLLAVGVTTAARRRAVLVPTRMPGA